MFARLPRGVLSATRTHAPIERTTRRPTCAVARRPSIVDALIRTPNPAVGWGQPYQGFRACLHAAVPRARPRLCCALTARPRVGRLHIYDGECGGAPCEVHDARAHASRFGSATC